MANPSQLPVAGEAKDLEENLLLLLHLKRTCVLKAYPYTQDGCSSHSLSEANGNDHRNNWPNQN